LEKLGIIAGSGKLPVLLARAAADQGRLPVIIQITNTPPHRFTHLTSEIYSLGIGQLRKATRIFLNAGVREIVMIGKVQKNVLLHPFRWDAAALKILAQNRKKGERGILSAVMNHFESNGLSVIEQHRFLPDLLPQPGVLTKKQPTTAQWDDLNYGISLARQVANLDIGQTVVVKNRIPLAVEAIEGTDEAIKRGGKLGGKGVIVAKAAAVHHDFRVDVPTIGSETLKVLHEVRGVALAVEAGRTFMLDADALCRQADRWNITIVAIESEINGELMRK
jgi:UDP-2,3-diacylglucosamine hydrolase